ncbi:MAG: hypothetical protein U0531_13580 [Dehalococcoidia bacterium]
MIQRALEIILKHKIIVMLPILLIVPATVVVALRPQEVQWQSFAVVWVDEYKQLHEDGRLGYTPALSQTQLLNSFLRTRTFSATVLSQTSLAPMLETPAGELDAIHRLWRSVSVVPNENNFFTVTVTTKDQQLSYEIARSLLDNYRAMLRSRTETQSQVATVYYADALKKAESDLVTSQGELSAYVARRPDILKEGIDVLVPVTLRDPTLARLTAQVNIAQETYSSLLRRYYGIGSDTAAGLEGQKLTFTVVDEPTPPFKPVQARRITMIKLPAIGLVLSILLSSVVAFVLVVTNRAVLGAADVRRITGLPVLGELPELRRRRRVWRRVPRSVVRLRMGAPASFGADTIRSA